MDSVYAIALKLLRFMLWSTADHVKRFLPRNRFGTWVYTLIGHVLYNRRFPRRYSQKFNDRMFYLRVSDEMLSPLRARISDKELVKSYISERVGNHYNVPTLAVLRDRESAMRYAYPARCVIKPTHGSGQIIIRENNEPVDLKAIDAWFSMNYYDWTREASYRDLTPKVIVEPIVFDRINIEDFKIFCVDGAPKLIQVDFDTRTRHTRSMYSVDWKKQDYGYCYPIGKEIDRPNNLDEMLSVARKLSDDFSFISVDLYTDGSQIYVGELTNCPDDGIGRFAPRSAELEASALLFS